MLPKKMIEILYIFVQGIDNNIMKEISTKQFLLETADLEKLGLKGVTISRCQMTHSKEEDRAAYAAGKNIKHDAVSIFVTTTEDI